MTTPANWRLWGKLASSGPASLTRGRWRTGRTYWVDSVNGHDSNSGLTKERPFKTLHPFLTTIPFAAGDKIVLRPNCNIIETTAAPYLITVPDVEFVGEGVGAAMARIWRNVDFSADDFSDSTIFTVGNGSLTMNNILFPAGSSHSELMTAAALGTDLILRDCIFELGEDDLEPRVDLLSGACCRAEGTTFRVVSGRPSCAVLIDASASEPATDPTSMEFVDCVIDGGVYGWADRSTDPLAQVAVEITSGVLKMRNTRLLNHSDVYVHAETNACVVDIDTTDDNGESLIGEDCSVVYGTGVALIVTWDPITGSTLSSFSEPTFTIGFSYTGGGPEVVQLDSLVITKISNGHEVDVLSVDPVVGAEGYLFTVVIDSADPDWVHGAAYNVSAYYTKDGVSKFTNAVYHSAAPA